MERYPRLETDPSFFVFPFLECDDEAPPHTHGATTTSPIPRLRLAQISIRLVAAIGLAAVRATILYAPPRPHEEDVNFSLSLSTVQYKGHTCMLREAARADVTLPGCPLGKEEDEESVKRVLKSKNMSLVGFDS